MYQNNHIYITLKLQIASLQHKFLFVNIFITNWLIDIATAKLLTGNAWQNWWHVFTSPGDHVTHTPSPPRHAVPKHHYVTTTVVRFLSQLAQSFNTHHNTLSWISCGIWCPHTNLTHPNPSHSEKMGCHMPSWNVSHNKHVQGCCYGNCFHYFMFRGCWAAQPWFLKIVSAISAFCRSRL